MLVLTREHALLYDAGPRYGDFDLGERVVVPSLRSLGVSKLDMMLLSHADTVLSYGARPHRSFPAAERRQRPSSAENVMQKWARMPTSASPSPPCCCLPPGSAVLPSPAFGDGHITGGPVGQRHLAQDDPDRVPGRAQRLGCGVGELGDQRAQLLG